jgi:hypothetical protein
MWRIQRFQNFGGEALLFLWWGGRELFVEGHIYFERNMGATIYFGSNFAWLKYFASHLVLVLAPNYNSTALCLQLMLEKLCYSLVELYVSSVYLNLFG